MPPLEPGTVCWIVNVRHAMYAMAVGRTCTVVRQADKYQHYEIDADWIPPDWPRLIHRRALRPIDDPPPARGLWRWAENFLKRDKETT